MNLKQVKYFNSTHRLCSDYFVGEDLKSLKLYLFRVIKGYELYWYIFEFNKNFDKNLMAVKLQEVSNIKHAKKLVKGFWRVCKKGEKYNE